MSAKAVVLQSAILTGLLVRRIARTSASSGPAPRVGTDLDTRRPVVSTVVFAASALGIGGLALVVYGTALVYNFGHLTEVWPWAVGSAVLVAVARLSAIRPASSRPVREHLPGPVFGGAVVVLSRFVAVFFVPALPVRYSLRFLTGWQAAVLGTVLLAAAAWGAAKDMRAGTAGPGTRRPMTSPAVIVPVAVTTAAVAGGTLRATAAIPGLPFPEIRILLVMAATVVAFLGSAVACDRCNGRRVGRAG